MGKSCGGVRCSEAPERKEKCFFNRDSEGAFGSESVIRGGSFWTRIRWGKAVAGSGVRKGARKERKVFFNRDSEGAFGSESAIRGGSFGPELDGEKLWRGQVFGARMGARKERTVFF